MEERKQKIKELEAEGEKLYAEVRKIYEKANELKEEERIEVYKTYVGKYFEINTGGRETYFVRVDGWRGYKEEDDGSRYLSHIYGVEVRYMPDEDWWTGIPKKQYSVDNNWILDAYNLGVIKREITEEEFNDLKKKAIEYIKNL